MDALTADDPSVLGRYTLLGRLGAGGQGVVYLGRTATGEQVAVKALNPLLVQNTEALRRFAGEVDHVRQVSSFCVAEVLDADLTGARPYVVSEYVEGRSLQETVEREGPRGPGQLRRLAVGTMTALAAIHAAGIVHRDLKPHNVLIGSDGPRVIDFGIARVLGSQATVAGAVIGTVVYMAPEQVVGGDIGPPADLFAWASTIAFAAGGRPPFGTGGAAEVMYRIVNGEPELPPLPADLRGVVRDCLAKDPAARPTAKDVLLKLIGDQPAAPNQTTVPQDREATVVQAAPAMTLVEEPARGRRGRGPLVVGAAAVTALVAAAALAITFWPKSGTPEAKLAGAEYYTEDFNERPDWDGYTFNPDGAPDQRTVHGYEPEKADYAMFADQGYPRNPALSPSPAKNAAAAEPRLNYAVLATVRELKGKGEVGLLCRWDEDDGSGYLFLLGSDGRARVVRYAAGVSSDLGTGKASAASEGAQVRLQASCGVDGKDLVFEVNGEKVVQATDPSPLAATTRSQIGLFVQVPEAGDNKIIAAFDDFMVTKPGA